MPKPSQRASRKILLVRHGSTHLNSENTSVDRLRGHIDIPLDKLGREEAAKTGRQLANDPPDVLVSSDLCRASESAKIISKATGVPVSEVSKGFRPWDVGKYAGQLSKKAVPILVAYIHDAPDKKLPGDKNSDGESFNDFIARFLCGVAGALDKYKGIVAIVSHHRNERALHALKAKGWTGELDLKIFAQRGETTGAATAFDIPVDRLRAIVAKRK